MTTENQETNFHPQNIEQPTIKVLFNPSKRKKVRSLMLSIEGAFTIYNIDLISKAIYPVFPHYDYVNIKLRNITLIDLTAIQLLHVLKAIYQPNGKTITIDAQLSKEDEALMVQAGF